MKIALNIIYCAPGRVGGTQTYAEHLMAEIAKADSVNEYIVYANKDGAKVAIPNAPNFSVVICPVDAKNLASRYVFEQLELPKRLKADNVDVCFSLGYVCPLRLPVASVVCIHDVNFIALKDAMSPWKRLVFGYFVRQSAIRADHVLTVSEFSKQEITERIGVRAEKTTVTLLGPRDYKPNAVTKAEIVLKYGLSKPYLIAFSSHSDHKNMPRLLESFATIIDDFPHDLVLVGRVPSDGKLDHCIRELGLSDRVVVTGYVPDEHVMPLIRYADLFVFPSYYEGFGLPALDAQLAGTAIASSSAGSLPEVLGDGAEYFDPFSVNDMATVLRDCLSDEGLRNDLVQKGKANLGRFSWKTTATKTLDVLHSYKQGNPR
ncbi:MAG TPA: glycosyltransferase family 1 protein [Capsulimonadaceae bacterium]|jgi:glycosyltransferase involved in cell wall biosynthesis